MGAEQSSTSPNAVHTVLMLLIVGTVLAVPWMLPDGSEEVEVEVEEEETWPSILRPVLMMMLPLALLLVVRWSASEQAASLALRKADKSTIHRVAGSSPGLLLLLLLILAMISFHSSLQQLWGVSSE